MLGRASARSARLRTPSASQGPSSAVGPTLAASAPSAPQVVSASSTPQASRVTSSRKKNQAVKSFFTPECHRTNSCPTCTDSSCSCETIFLTNIPDASRPLKSRMSDPESTSADPDFYEYWDSSRQDRYRRLLWLPEIGSPGLVSSSLSGFAQNTPALSSFSITKTEPLRKSLEKTSCLSYKYTVVDGMVAAATKPEEDKKMLRTLKLKLDPNAVQKAKLAEFAGCSRFTYNRAVAARLGEGSTHKSVFRIRDRFVTNLPRGQGKKENSFFRNRQWLLRCPKSVRQGAVKAAVANVKACFSNLAAGNIKKFSAPFRTKKAELERGWAIEMDQLNVSRDGDKLYIFKDILGGMRYFNTKQLRKLMPGVNPEHDPKVQKSRFGEYFLLLSVPVKDRRCERRPAYPGRGAAASIDPGVRKTIVTYSPENEESFMLGKGQANQLVELLRRHDKLQASLDGKINNNKKRELRQRMMRLRRTFSLSDPPPAHGCQGCQEFRGLMKYGQLKFNGI